MKIAHVIQEYYPALGGGPLAVYLRVRALNKIGIENEVFTTNIVNTAKKTTIEAGSYCEDSVTIHRLSAINLNPHYVIVPRLFTNLLKSDCDIYHAYGYGYFATEVTALVSKLTDRPMIFSPCGYFPATMHVNSIFTNAYRLIANKNSLRISRFILVDSNDDYNIYSTFAQKNKIRIIPGPTLEETVLGQNFSSFEFKRRYGINSPYFFCLGRINQSKGFQNVIASIPKFFKLSCNNDIQFVIAGADQGYSTALRALARSLGVDEKVTIIENLEENLKFPAMSGALAFVLPSFYETYGSVVNEAMAVGTPVICTKFGGAYEKLPEGELSRIVDPRDERQMAEALYWAYTLGQEDISRIRKAYREAVIKGHTVESTSKKVSEIYEYVMRNEKFGKMPKL